MTYNVMLCILTGSEVPAGYVAQAIHGFVEELVVNDDPEYQVHCTCISKFLQSGNKVSNRPPCHRILVLSYSMYMYMYVHVHVVSGVDSVFTYTSSLS